MEGSGALSVSGSVQINYGSRCKMPRWRTLVLRRPNRSHLRFNLINRLTSKNNEGFGSWSGSRRLQRTYKKRDRNKISCLNCLMFSFEGWMVLLYLECLDEDPGWRKFKLFKKYHIHFCFTCKIVKNFWVLSDKGIPVLHRYLCHNLCLMYFHLLAGNTVPHQPLKWFCQGVHSLNPVCTLSETFTRLSWNLHSEKPEQVCTPRYLHCEKPVLIRILTVVAMCNSVLEPTFWETWTSVYP
jgi:hypothetical protein